jgi:hypothetical protein
MLASADAFIRDGVSLFAIKAVNEGLPLSARGLTMLIGQVFLTLIKKSVLLLSDSSAWISM